MNVSETVDPNPSFPVGVTLIKISSVNSAVTTESVWEPSMKQVIQLAVIMENLFARETTVSTEDTSMRR